MMKRIIIATLSITALSTVISLPALALSNRFESERLETLDKLNNRFESERLETLNKLNDRFEEERQQTLDE
ncbi:hypothetical protein H6F95_16335 [Cyanobacteria bacterium FACHB-471]|nr:hypothetical protein [Cyanobacteria bacterium FACHB-471]